MFIKKRKITKASIDELAKRYPQDIISDEDAENIVGGAHYYIGGSGTMSYRIGSSDEIRLISAVPDAGSLSGMAYHELNRLPGSTSLSAAGESDKNAVIRKIAADQGYYNVYAEYISDGTIWGQSEYLEGVVDKITINTRFMSTNPNLADIRTVMFHEMVHRDCNTNGSITGNIGDDGIAFRNEEAMACYKSWKYAKNNGATQYVVSTLWKRYEESQGIR